MTRDPRTRELRCYRTILGCMICALPASTRRLYGDELADVYDDLLRGTFNEFGIQGVRRRMPGIITNALAAIGLEYVDAWRGASLPPLRFATWSLIGAALIWALSVVATLADGGWAAAILELHLGVTVTLMLGLPVFSLVASCVGASAGQPTEGRYVLGTSIAATGLAWAVLACHVVA